MSDYEYCQGQEEWNQIQDYVRSLGYSAESIRDAKVMLQSMFDSYDERFGPDDARWMELKKSIRVYCG